MVFEGFITSYKQTSGELNIYCFPGRNNSGRPLYNFSIITKDADYLYKTESDGSINFIVNSAPNNSVTVAMVNINSGKQKKYIFNLDEQVTNVL